VIEVNSAQANAVGYFDDVSFAVATAAIPPSPSAALAGKMVVLSWQGTSTLQSAPSLTGPWGDVTGATSPYTWDPASASIQFFRLRN
jgi:hypothetical protein